MPTDEFQELCDNVNYLYPEEREDYREQAPEWPEGHFAVVDYHDWLGFFKHEADAALYRMTLITTRLTAGPVNARYGERVQESEVDAKSHTCHLDKVDGSTKVGCHTYCKIVESLHAAKNPKASA